MSAPVRHPAQPERRSMPRARTWWGKSWVRAVEEAAYGDNDLKKARALARSGRIGAVTISAEGFVAAVEDPEGVWTVSGQLPPFEEADVDGFCEALEAEAGRLGALLSGDLPHGLVEHAEEAGVELLPYGGELVIGCSCEAWVDPCVHGLAVLYQLTWLLEEDPFVLLHLRGWSRADLLARLEHRVQAGPAGAARTDERDEDPDPDPDVDAAVDAALRADRMLELAEHGESFEHLI